MFDVVSASSLPEERLASLYEAPGFGGETTMRAKVIRELIDEIRCLRAMVESKPPREHPTTRQR
jgi:hypothetical protein